MADLGMPKPAEEQLNALEARCKTVKGILEEFASPWVVEFAGLPRAGKSGCISAVEHLLRRNEISVLTPFEGAGRAPEHLKDDLVAYNAWTAMYAIQQILEGSVRAEKKNVQQRYQVVLLDRGLFDATAWLHLFEEKGQLDDKEHKKTFTDFLRLKKWLSLVRQVFVFFCSPPVAVERELRGKLSAKPGRVVSEPFLSDLRAAYKKACDCYADDFDIVVLDTDGVEQEAVAYKVAALIFEAIERKKP